MEFFGTQIWGNPISAYAVFASIVVGSFIAAKITKAIVNRYAMKWAEKTESKWDDVIVKAIMGPATWLVAIGGAMVAVEGLILSERAEIWFYRILSIGAIMVLYRAIYKLIKGGSELVAEGFVKKNSVGLDDEGVAALEKSAARVSRQVKEVAGMVIVILAFLTILSNIGVDLKAIWASLGIGGVVLALAVKEPLSDIVGRIEIYSSGLFDEGHVVQVDDWTGTVKKIGTFRTRIELLSDMSTVMIPNSEFVRKPIKNNYGRKKFIFKWDLDVPYDVDADQISDLIVKLRAMLLANPVVLDDFCHVYLDRLDKYSKVVRVWFQLKAPDWSVASGLSTSILSDIQKLFATLGIDFAFPTYSLKLENSETTPGR